MQFVWQAKLRWNERKWKWKGKCDLIVLSFFRFSFPFDNGSALTCVVIVREKWNIYNFVEQIDIRVRIHREFITFFFSHLCHSIVSSFFGIDRIILYSLLVDHNRSEQMCIWYLISNEFKHIDSNGITGMHRQRVAKMKKKKNERTKKKIVPQISLDDDK